jgi:oligopeptide transport system substrate-binding protein
MRRLVPVVLALAACGLPDGEYFGKVKDDPDPDHIIWCNSGEPEYLDPALASSTTDNKPVYAMFDGLTEYGLDGLPEKSVATSWDISQDQRTFTFHLREDARWSDGRPVTAHDFAYHIARVLHPLTGSKNAETHWKLKNGELYTANRVKMITHAVNGFAVGDIVEIVGQGGKVEKDLKSLEVPNPNQRASTKNLRLREQGATEKDAYATVPSGEPVTLVELSPDHAWAYVFWDEDDGVYGWVPAAELDVQPNKDVTYTVRRVPPNHIPGVNLPPDPEGTARPTAVVTGADMLMLPEVLGVRVPDDHTLVLETWGPLPYMIDQTPQRAFRATPRWVVSRWPKRWVYPEHVVTSGAYHMVDWRMRDRIELVRSKTFWDAKNVKIERFTVFSLNDQAANTNLYIQGSCDALASNNIPAAYLPYLTENGRNLDRFKDFALTPYLGIYIYIVNTQKLTNVHYRRALSLAVDRSQLPFITRGGETPTAQYTPGTAIAKLSDAELRLCGITRDTKGVAAIVIKDKLCYVPPPGLDFDLAKAREELELARKEMGPAFKNGFSIKFNSGVESHKLIAELLQHEWSTKLGLKVQLESQEWKTFLKDTVNGEYDVARMGWIGNFPDPEAEFLGNFKCTSPDNRSKYCSEKYDALMAKAEGTADRVERLAIAREAEREMIESAPIVPLYVYTAKHLRKPYVKDMAINFVDQVPFRRVWIDPAWRAHGVIPRDPVSDQGGDRSGGEERAKK